MKRAKLVISLILIVAMMFSSVSAVAAQSAAKGGGTIKYSILSDPRNLNPIISDDVDGGNLDLLMFSPLLTYDKDMKIQPYMAESFTVSKDCKTITFKLRKGWKWHDGVEVTSADVKFTWEAILDPKVLSPRIDSWSSVAAIETPDKYTAVFKLKEVNSSIIDKFVDPYLIPKHIFEKIDRNKISTCAASMAPIGNGPYTFVEWKKMERIVLKKNPNFFFGDQGGADQWIWLINPNQATSLLRVETKEANMCDVPTSDVARMKKLPNLDVKSFTTTLFTAVWWNIKTPYFSDIKVRQALSYAINKQAIITGITKGIGTKADSIYVPAFWCYNPNIKKYDYNVTKAKQLLDQAGWKVGKNGIREKNGVPFKFTILCNKGNTNREKMLVFVQSSLKPLGIQVEPRAVEWNTLYEKYVDPRKYDAFLGGLSTGSDFNQIDLVEKGGYWNMSQYDNPKVVDLFKKVRATFDKEVQRKYLNEAQAILAEEVPMTVLMYVPESYAFHTSIKNEEIKFFGWFKSATWFVQ